MTSCQMATVDGGSYQAVVTRHALFISVGTDAIPWEHRCVFLPSCAWLPSCMITMIHLFRKKKIGSQNLLTFIDDLRLQVNSLNSSLYWKLMFNSWRANGRWGATLGKYVGQLGVNIESVGWRRRRGVDARPGSPSPTLAGKPTAPLSSAN